MSQLSSSNPFNWQELQNALEPLIRQIVREELAHLTNSTPIEISQTESHQQELKAFFAQFKADVTHYRFDREEANER